ncbi:hypothetical protein BDQ17DRAFT_1421223 [Cyathus striatus]|nr:hypothetical protein BDQ17DRAFT_1421223 [Cyathus striatus]
MEAALSGIRNQTRAGQSQLEFGIWNNRGKYNASQPTNVGRIMRESKISHQGRLLSEREHPNGQAQWLAVDLGANRAWAGIDAEVNGDDEILYDVVGMGPRGIRVLAMEPDPTPEPSKPSHASQHDTPNSSSSCNYSNLREHTAQVLLFSGSSRASRERCRDKRKSRE